MQRDDEQNDGAQWDSEQSDSAQWDASGVIVSEVRLAGRGAA